VSDRCDLAMDRDGNDHSRRGPVRDGRNHRPARDNSGHRLLFTGLRHCIHAISLLGIQTMLNKKEEKERKMQCKKLHIKRLIVQHQVVIETTKQRSDVG